MPLYQVLEKQDCKLAIWRIEEDADWFDQHFYTPEISHEKKLLQWYATRHLVNHLCGEQVEVIKDEFGKPLIANSFTNLSLTHTALFAGALISDKHEVGIDLEMISPKVERIAPKFLKPEELATIEPEEKIEKLILLWSAKEALYKLHGRRRLEFKSQLLIEPFEMQQSGEMRGSVIAPDMHETGLRVHYEFFQDHVLTYVVGR